MADKAEKKVFKKYGELSENDLKALIQKHGIVYTLVVLFSEGEEIVELYGYIKRPERFVMGMALSVIDSNPVKSKEIILEKSWLAGDERIKTEDDAFYSASTVLDELFMVRRAELKKN
jgi:hypothetical protein